jgi:hypothetical protein
MAATVQTVIFWAVTLCSLTVLYIVTNVSEQHAASIFGVQVITFYIRYALEGVLLSSV